VEGQIKGTRCVEIDVKEEQADLQFTNCALKVFGEIQGILGRKHKRNALIQVVVAGLTEYRLLEGLAGLLKTAQLENTKLVCQLIQVEQGEKPEIIIEMLKQDSRNPEDTQIRYQSGKRHVLDWKEIIDTGEEVTIPWKDKGVYLITGGAGGLGLIFARDIAGKVNAPTLILTGRNPLSNDKEALLKEMEVLGAKVMYRQTDVTDREAVGSLIEDIQSQFGRLDGIMHCAGIIRDNFIIKKTEDEFKDVLAPKVTGLVNLDRVTKDKELDFFIMFSSTSGCFGNLGQADYSSANAFMDAYAAYRNSLTSKKQRSGLTLSVNWPLWKEGGMHVDAQTEEILLNGTGMVALQTETGIKALYRCLKYEKSNISVIEGKLEHIRRKFLHNQDTQADKSGYIEEKKLSAAKDSKNVLDIKEDLLQDKTVNYLKNEVSSVIMLSSDRIEENAPMEKYGIDSMLSMQLVNQLEKTFGSLPKTLFFEYQNIRELAGYFIESHRDKLIKVLGLEKTEDVQHVQEDNLPAVVEPLKIEGRSIKPSRFIQGLAGTDEEKAPGALDIAIIGLSGRYPRQPMWRNSGKTSKTAWIVLRNT
jgi:NADP-dependent 3-hydroxy acid dehydrogenase YdfG/acyl carrier protein